MIEVTKETFFRAIGPENVHPFNERERTVWSIQDSRVLVGESTPGYASPPHTPHRYWLTDEFARRKGVA